MNHYKSSRAGAIVYIIFSVTGIRARAAAVLAVHSQNHRAKVPECVLVDFKVLEVRAVLHNHRLEAGMREGVPVYQSTALTDNDTVARNCGAFIGS